jgi:hypothetical protein
MFTCIISPLITVQSWSNVKVSICAFLVRVIFTVAVVVDVVVISSVDFIRRRDAIPPGLTTCVNVVRTGYV